MFSALALLASTFKIDIFHKLKQIILLPAGSPPQFPHRGAVERSDQSSESDAEPTCHFSSVQTCGKL